MKKELRKYLNNIIQSEVTYSRAGGGAGSIISIKLNGKDNSLYALWIECDWRIEYKNKVIATSADDIEPITGLIAKSVKMLEGKIVDSVKMTPFYDLRINFSDGFCLNIFCIFSYTYEFETNWYLAIPEQNLAYEITNYFKIKKGSYN
jgi:hypothetical protein